MRAALTLLITLAVAAPAAASGVASVDPATGVLRFDADPGTVVSITLSSEAGDVVLYNGAWSVLRAGAGCRAAADHMIRCPEAGITAAEFFLGDDSDLLDSRVAIPVTAHGGDGNDSVFGRANGGAFHGDDGNDYVGSEPDGVPRSADVLDGGPGLGDTVGYPTRSASVAVSLNGPASHDDGAPGEGDDVRGAERIAGGQGPDVLVGSTETNTLYGNGGDDHIEGDPGAPVAPVPDEIVGGEGTDVVVYAQRTQPVTVRLFKQSPFFCQHGQAGEGDCMREVEDVVGGAGDDVLVGTEGANVLEGMGGDDYLEPLAGVDEVGGGAGANDRVSYVGRAAAVKVSLNGLADDGAAGENDLVRSDVESVRGGNGPDELVGNAGANRLYGEGGDDELIPRGGTDAAFGGSGTDRVSYVDRTATQPVRVTLNGKADDGAPGENDAVHGDVESIRGGEGSDVLIGSDAGGMLAGAGGDDLLEPLGGADDVRGGTGTDRVTYAYQAAAVTVRLNELADDGGPGEGDNVRSDVETVRGTPFGDLLVGNDKPNTLQGLGGPDDLRPGPGADVVDAGEGDDTVAAIDGTADTITCGDGLDSVTADPIDVLAASCEGAAAPSR